MGDRTGGFVERWSGWFVRGISGLLFLYGALILLFLPLGGDAAFLPWAPVLMAPYLVIRYRDPDVSVVPGWTGRTPAED